MADKLRKTFPLKITMSAGEAPSAAKLNAISNSARNSTDVLEQAIGDIWGQSGDTTFGINYPVLIPNLARAVGESKYLNPAIQPIVGVFSFKEIIEDSFIGATRGSLKFIPTLGSTFSGVGIFITKVATPNLLLAAGDYYIESSTGRWLTYSPVTGGGADSLIYEADTALIRNSTNDISSSFIPDLRSSAFTSCRLEFNTGKYYLHLPPRSALSFLSSGELFQTETPNKYLSTAELADTVNKTGLISPYSYFQDPTLGAVSDSFYRYSLPSEFIGITTEGEEYPVGSLLLWDSVNNKIVQDVLLKRPTGAPHAGKSWVLEVISTDVDFIALSSVGDEAPISYSTGLHLVVVGGSLSKQINYLSSALMNHNHSPVDGFNTSPISHNDIIESTDLITEPKGPSKWENDTHIGLLHRRGSTGNTGTERDPLDNALLGNLLISNSNETLLNGSSFKLSFGTLSGGSLYTNASSELELLPEGPGLFLAGKVRTSGNLGVNTASTVNALEVLGTSNFSGLITAAGGISSTSTLSAGTTLSITGTSTLIGNVGIGASSPSAHKLLVTASVAETYIAAFAHFGQPGGSLTIHKDSAISCNSGLGSTLKIGSDIATGFISTTTFSDLRVSVNGTEGARFKTDGSFELPNAAQVRIGRVGGPIASLVDVISNNGDTLRLGNPGDADGPYIGSLSGQNFRLTAGNQPRVWVSAAGDVNIGAGLPIAGNKLQVDGDLKVNGVIKGVPTVIASCHVSIAGTITKAYNINSTLNAGFGETKTLTFINGINLSVLDWSISISQNPQFGDPPAVGIVSFTSPNSASIIITGVSPVNGSAITTSYIVTIFGAL